MRTDELAISLTINASRFARSAILASANDVSSVTWRVASMLEAYGPMRPSQIAARERTSRATTTKLLQRLEREGLIQSLTNDADARSYLVDLTPAGRQSLQQWRSRLATALVPALERLDAAQIRTLIEAESILQTITGQLEGK